MFAFPPISLLNLRRVRQDAMSRLWDAGLHAKSRAFISEISALYDFQYTPFKSDLSTIPKEYSTILT
jgi:hypothetical protein